MKSTVRILIYLPLIISAQGYLEKTSILDKIDPSVYKGHTIHKQAGKGKVEYRENLFNGHYAKDNTLDKEFKKLGVNNLDRFEIGLLNNGIME